MVLCRIKKGEESLFLLEVAAVTAVAEALQRCVRLHNGRCRVTAACSELESLCQYGASLPPTMVGLLEEQIAELKLTDDWSEQHGPSGGAVINKDPCGKRNGQQPTPKMQEVIVRTVAEAKGSISKDMIKNNKTLTEQHIIDSLSMLRGAVSIVYPMGLPPYDPVEEILGKGGDTRPVPEIFDASLTRLWFAGKELQMEKRLSDYIGKNEKTKVVLKLSQVGQGAPGREPQLSADQQASMMQYWHRRQQELKKLDEDDDDSYHNSAWADSSNLQRQFHGLENIKWRPL